jgi:hypothetical protein
LARTLKLISLSAHADRSVFFPLLSGSVRSMSNVNSFCDTENVHVPFNAGHPLMSDHTHVPQHAHATQLRHVAHCGASIPCVSSAHLCVVVTSPLRPFHPRPPRRSRWPSCGLLRHQSGRGRQGCHRRELQSFFRPQLWSTVRTLLPKGCGYALIYYGSGSSIFSNCGSGFRIRIPDPDPGFGDLKFKKKFPAGNLLLIFLIQNCNLLIPGPP